ncbi:hypothetical protein B0H13DRAFT_2060653 [Mycena leptocephala]|nr:hypothetical protein B0H13DRAFT_2060653 [Mycena leptocephala]
MSAPELLLAVSSIALALLATFISVKFALFFDGFVNATALSLTFIAVSMRYCILRLASTVSTLLSPIIALCLAAYIVVRLRAFVDQPLTVPDPLFGPARRIADQVVGVLCSRVWNMGLAMRGYNVAYPEDTDEAVSEMGTPLPDAKGSVPHNLV